MVEGHSKRVRRERVSQPLPVEDIPETIASQLYVCVCRSPKAGDVVSIHQYEAFVKLFGLAAMLEGGAWIEA